MNTGIATKQLNKYLRLLLWNIVNTDTGKISNGSVFPKPLVQVSKLLEEFSHGMKEA